MMLMDEKAHFVVGIDIGTSMVRSVVGSVERGGKVSVVGYGEASSSGMRRGAVANLAGPAEAIDMSLKPAQDMSGTEVGQATLGVNGAHVMSTKANGMIVVGVADHEIDGEDLARVEGVASVGKIPENREILGVVAYEYKLDGQGGIKNPLGMKGTRLEVEANVLSNLKPLCDNLRRAAEMAEVKVEQLVPTAVAAARAVLTEQQMENGAEKIKLRFASGRFGVTEKDVVLKEGREELRFAREEVDSVVEARLEEIFDGVQKELKKAGYQKRLPEGLVLTGGGAKMKDIESYAREQVGLAVRIGVPIGVGGLSDDVAKPEYAVAVGLMLMSADYGMMGADVPSKKSFKNKDSGGGWLKRIFGFFK